MPAAEPVDDDDNVVNLFGDSEAEGGEPVDEDGDDDIGDEDEPEDEGEDDSMPQSTAKSAFPRATNVTTVDRERVVERMPGAKPPTPVVQLLAVWGDRGQMLVCKAVDGNPIEQYRMPTAEEFALLKQGGRMVRGGFGEAPAAPAAPGMSKLLIGGLAVAAIGAAAYFYTKKKEEEFEEDVEDIDD